MCGLVGIYSSNMLQRHKNAMKTLLFFDTLRGSHSTGLFTLKLGREYNVFKAAVPGYDFIEDPRLDQNMRLTDYIWMGHNRFATMGAKTKLNAHPFEVLDEDGDTVLVGAHNGTLKDKYKIKNHQLYGTDSEALYNAIYDQGLKETIADTEGAWALSFYNFEKDELNFLRNKERTLYFAFEDDRKTMIWASEVWMIRVACEREAIKLHEDKVFFFEEDTLYTFPKVKSNDIITYKTTGGLAGKAPTFFSTGPDWWERTRPSSTPQNRPQQKALTDQSKSGGDAQQTGVGSQGRSSSKSNNDKVVDITTGEKVRGFNGQPISKRLAKKITDKGCAWCEHEDIKVDGAYGWLNATQVVCKKCLTDTHKPQELTLDDPWIDVDLTGNDEFREDARGNKVRVH